MKRTVSQSLARKTQSCEIIKRVITENKIAKGLSADLPHLVRDVDSRLHPGYLLKEIYERTLSYKSKNGYIKAKSTETALHEVINTIERSEHYKKYTFDTSLD